MLDLYKFHNSFTVLEPDQGYTVLKFIIKEIQKELVHIENKIELTDEIIAEELDEIGFVEIGGQYVVKYQDSKAMVVEVWKILCHNCIELKYDDE